MGREMGVGFGGQLQSVEIHTRVSTSKIKSTDMEFISGQMDPFTKVLL